ncbi:O-antigen ligase family protein, partial [candidate division WWE3 bacterium]|nr:O-antigen ligase family protein [candidate division WWE3 bacterium]
FQIKIKEEIESIFRSMVCSALVLAVLGLSQLVLFPDLSVISGDYGWDPHKNRLFSTFLDPNFTGGYLVLGFLLNLYVYWKDRKLFWLAALAVLGLSIFLTFSRSTWFMFSIAALIVGLFKSKKIILITFLVMFLSYYMVPRVQTRLSGITDPNDSARYRLVSWKNALTVSKENIVTGVGFNSYRYFQEKHGFFDYKEPLGGHAGSGSDSSLLLVLATTGFLGFVFYSAMFLSLFVEALKDYFMGTGWMPLMVLAMISGLLIHSQFVNSLFYPQYMLWYFVIFGLYSSVLESTSYQT